MSKMINKLRKNAINFVKASRFEDGRKVDYVIVISRVSARINTKLLNRFMQNLQMYGLDLEQAFGLVDPVIYIKINISDECMDFMRKYVPIWDHTRNVNKDVDLLSYVTGKKCPLEKEDVNEGTDYAGRIYYIVSILKRTKFGSKLSQHGIERLIQKHIVLESFPLHDGPIEDKDPAFNDRSLLYHFWGNLQVWYYNQPLDFIKRYYGVGIGLYYAWFGFYIQMLVPMVILSLLTIIACALRRLVYGKRTDFLFKCKFRTDRLCDVCVKGDKCYFETFNENCYYFDSTDLVDNSIINIYSIIFSIWTGVLVNLWARQEKNLQFRWNLWEHQTILNERTRFVEAVPYRRKSPYSGKLETYLPRYVKMIRNVIVFVSTCAIGLTMLVILFLNINLVEYLRVLALQRGIRMLRIYYDCVLFMCHMIVTRSVVPLINLLTIKLTRFRQHRYHESHNNLFLLIRCAVGFINQCSMFLYFAFFRGNLYQIPFESFNWYIKYDTCVTSCVLSLWMLIICRCVWLLFEQVISMGFHVIKTKLSKKPWRLLPQYEMEYHLVRTTSYSFQVGFYMIIVHHSILSLFARNNIFGPMLTILILSLELRLESNYLLKYCRRPQPRIYPHMHVWTRILAIITEISLFVNAAGLAFNSEGVENFFYQMNVHEIDVYVSKKMSVYAVGDYFEGSNLTCLYYGSRYPPDHERKYQRTQDFYHILSYKFGFLVLTYAVFKALIRIFSQSFWYDYLDKLKTRKCRKKSNA